MSFAVSYATLHKEDASNRDLDTNRIIKLITANGGQILKNGFEELFHAQDLTCNDTISAADALQTVAGARNLGFVCLIANTHSRKAKYMQALALGLPCLAARWVEDCVRRVKVLDWEPYLLPAGESAYLHGAIRSRVLRPYDPETARFITTIGNRKTILKGRSVLLIVGAGKVQQERRQAYVFLTCALGARRVERVATVEEARERILNPVDGADETWDWVYVDEAEPGSMQLLHGGGAATLAGKGKKRKRASTVVAEPVPPALESRPENVERLKRVKVVGNDFVTQSLILGRLLEED
jgi:hypothetical protein